MLRQICLEKQPRKITGAFRKHSNNNTNIDNSHIGKSVKKQYPCYPLTNLLRRQLALLSGNDLIVSRKRKSLVEFNLQGYIFIFRKNTQNCSLRTFVCVLKHSYLVWLYYSTKLKVSQLQYRYITDMKIAFLVNFQWFCLLSYCNKRLLQSRKYFYRKRTIKV